MRVIFKESETGKVIYRTDDSNIIPDVGESVFLEKRLYKVEERTFYYDEKKVSKQNSCTLWVRREEQL